MQSSSSNKIINYILRNNIKSCERFTDKRSLLEKETADKYNIFIKGVNKQCTKLLDFCKKEAQNLQCISKINQHCNKLVSDNKQKFTENFKNIEAIILLNNKLCFSDAVLSYENRVIDNFDKCVIASMDSHGLSGCEDLIKNFIAEFN